MVIGAMAHDREALLAYGATTVTDPTLLGRLPEAKVPAWRSRAASRPGPRVPRNPVALFCPGCCLVARLSWARLGHPRSPAPRTSRWGLGCSRLLRILAFRIGVVGWGSLPNTVVALAAVPDVGARPYVDETVTAGCPRHYPVVPIHHPRTPATRKL
jgi:hypothetical protein